MIAALLGTAAAPALVGESTKSQQFRFLARHCAITFTTRQLPPYSGKPLELKVDTGQSGFSRQRFLGSANVVAILAVDSRNRPCDLRLRERTTVEKRRPDLPERPPFEKTIRLVNGRAVDLQVFGLDLSGMTKRQQARSREQFLGAVEIVNQELFVEDDTVPFGVLTWRRSDQDIVILRAE
ncbi:MAG TPA: hypothetical protein VL285_01280 [Bryobacteraceae bacterium]|jgi:hypothetical protein|nr:hypothetical protein [Bryobacteraceae bacterium]